MQFTKNVNSTDGFFDITIAKNLTIFDLILNIKNLYNGNIVNHKKIETYKTKEITVIPQTSKPFIQADGELVGKGKVTAKIIEKAIHFVVN
jgi:diacylglycerol kinase (ATP)